MKQYLLPLAFGIFFFATSCHHEPDIFILKFWDECGQCTPTDFIFSLKEEGLYDQNNQLLPDSLFQAVKLLYANRPGILCSDARETYGCGTCYDGLSYFMQTKCAPQ